MRRLSFFISEELDAGLKALKAEHGTPEAETIRRALTAYLAEKGAMPQKATKPTRRSKRS
jgi:predicted DNA-binding protein